MGSGWHSHTVYEEMEHLTGLGKHAAFMRKKMSRLELLKKYREAMDKRTWPEKFDLEKLRRFVDEEIAAETEIESMVKIVRQKAENEPPTLNV